MSVSRETQERLEAFVALLLQWNRTINLISRKDEPNIWERHVGNSLLLAKHLPAHASHGIDIGSGGGFPGLILAIATDILFHLVEADGRKAAFLREAARASGTLVTVHAKRIEEAVLPRAPVITARAVASLPQLLTWSEPLLANGGICLFLKGDTVAPELALAQRLWHMQVASYPSSSGSDILKISEVSRA